MLFNRDFEFANSTYESRALTRHSYVTSEYVGIRSLLQLITGGEMFYALPPLGLQQHLFSRTLRKSADNFFFILPNYGMRTNILGLKNSELQHENGEKKWKSWIESYRIRNEYY